MVGDIRAAIGAADRLGANLDRIAHYLGLDNPQDTPQSREQVEKIIRDIYGLAPEDMPQLPGKSDRVLAAAIVTALPAPASADHPEPEAARPESVAPPEPVAPPPIQEIGHASQQEGEETLRRAREQRILDEAHREGRRLEPGELSRLLN